MVLKNWCGIRQIENISNKSQQITKTKKQEPNPKTKQPTASIIYLLIVIWFPGLLTEIWDLRFIICDLRLGVYLFGAWSLWFEIYLFGTWVLRFGFYYLELVSCYLRFIYWSLWFEIWVLFIWSLWFKIWDLLFGTWLLWFEIYYWNLGFEIWDLLFGTWDLGFEIFPLCYKRDGTY